jgi:DNA mismatch repair ATPase MutS
MEYSLIYKIKEESTNPDCLDVLLIDKAVRIITPDTKISEYVLSVLKNPLTLKENIIYRREIIDDFNNNPELLNKLTIIINELNKINEYINKNKIITRKTFQSTNIHQRIDETESFIVFKFSTEYMEKVLSFIQKIIKAFENCDIKSEGLKELYNYYKNISNTDEYNELNDITNKLTSTNPLENKYILNMDITNLFKFINVELHDIKKNQIKKKTLFNKINPFVAKTEYNVNTQTTAEAHEMLKTALNNFTALLFDTASGLCKKIAAISNELMFYTFAQRYHDYFIKANCPMIYPQISDKPNINVNINLYDLYLSVTGIYNFGNNKSVIANSIKMDDNTAGILVQGANNSGKTVYLRSAGYAIIFFQAGLKICAEESTMSIRKGIYTLYSSSEEAFATNDVSGRFESEVKMITSMLDNINPGAFILINELFQSTSYDEGGAGITPILNAFSELGLQWIFVTHIENMGELINNSETNRIICWNMNQHRVSEQ